jgi:hypothetical protein
MVICYFMGIAGVSVSLGQDCSCLFVSTAHDIQQSIIDEGIIHLSMENHLSIEEGGR